MTVVAVAPSPAVGKRCPCGRRIRPDLDACTACFWGLPQDLRLALIASTRAYRRALRAGAATTSEAARVAAHAHRNAVAAATAHITERKEAR